MKLDESPTPDGTLLTLWQRGDEMSIRAGAQVLMGSRDQGSEVALATLALAALRSRARPSVLVAGLGFGYTLRATLEHLPPEAEVVVSELAPAVVRWNRTLVGKLAGHPLGDPRVRVVEGDVQALVRKREQSFDAILLDVDNGPQALSQAGNAWLYSQPGLLRLARVLRSGGVLGVWSAGDDHTFTGQLRASGFDVVRHRVRARAARGSGRHDAGKGAHHVIWVSTPSRRHAGPAYPRPARPA